MAKVFYNGTILAESEDLIEVEGNIYFPHDAIKKEFFKENTSHSTCPWKGRANYYDIVVGEFTLHNAAWYYPNTKESARNIENRVAFYQEEVDIKG